MASQFGPKSAFDREKDLRLSRRVPVRDASGRLNTGEGAYRYLQRSKVPWGVSYNIPVSPSTYGVTKPGAADDRWVMTPGSGTGIRSTQTPYGDFASASAASRRKLEEEYEEFLRLMMLMEAQKKMAAGGKVKEGKA
jgi:hypothetical protein